MAISAHQKEIIVPPRIEPGATLGIVAPASPFERAALERGVTVLQQLGYAVRLADGLFAKEGYLAGEDVARAAQLHEMFADASVDAIISARGGYGALRVLPLLDFDLIAAHPKALIGFSDVTALLNLVRLKTGLVTFHGPMACTIHKGDNQTRESLVNVLTGSQSVLVVAEDGTVIRPGSAEGTLLGGNLATLCHLLATPFSPSFGDCILFLEETGEALYRVDRMLTQMRMSGCLDNVAGFILGSFKDCGALADIYDLVAERLSDFNVPILAGLAAGHGDRNLTLPIGLRVQLDADQKQLEFLTVAKK